MLITSPLPDIAAIALVPVVLNCYLPNQPIFVEIFLCIVSQDEIQEGTCKQGCL